MPRAAGSDYISELTQLYEHLDRGEEASVLRTLFAQVENCAESAQHRKFEWEWETDELIYKQFNLLLSQIRGLVEFTRVHGWIPAQTREYLSTAAEKLDFVISQLFCCRFTRNHDFDVLEKSESTLKRIVGPEKYAKITDYKFCFVFYDNPEEGTKFVQEVIAPNINEIHSALHNSELDLFEALDVNYKKEPPVPRNGRRYTRLEAACIDFWYNVSELRTDAVKTMVKKGYVSSKSTFDKWARGARKSKLFGDDSTISRVGFNLCMQHNIVRHPVAFCVCQHPLGTELLDPAYDEGDDFSPLNWKGMLYLEVVPVNQNELGCPSLLKKKLMCPQTVNVLDYVGGYGPELDAFTFSHDYSYPTRNDKDGWRNIYESRLPEKIEATLGAIAHICYMLRTV